MGIADVLLLALGLSADAFAVSICKGLSVQKLKPSHALICGAYFGGFQALMPLIGYYLGASCSDLISSVVAPQPVMTLFKITFDGIISITSAKC